MNGKPTLDWTPIAAPVRKGRRLYRLCRCICGIERMVRTDGLTPSSSGGCGCRKRSDFIARVTKHGKCRFPEYAVWASMKDRCLNKNSTAYPYYGGRGISVCQEWQNSFVAFICDMGRRPSNKHTLERVDNECGYGKNNCAWESRIAQMNNTRWNRQVVIDERTLSVSQWARALGLSRSTFENRLKGLERRGSNLSVEAVTGYRYQRRKAA